MFPTTTSPPAGAAPTGRFGVRLPSLTGLRFPAAFAVFLFHASLTKPANSVFADPGVAGPYKSAVAQFGATGVTFFFVLSGFVLAWSRRDGDPLVSFWRRRLMKIYPNHVAAFVLAMGLFAWSATKPHQGIANILLLQAWVPEYDTYLGVNPPSWSLSVEAVFYLSFPLLYALVRRIRPVRLGAWFVATAAGVALIAVLCAVLLPDTPTTPDALPLSTWQYWANYVFPPSRVLDFALGLLLARLVKEGRWPRIAMLPSLGLLAVAYVVALHVPYLLGQRAICLVPIACVVAAAVRGDITERPSLLRSRLAVHLGEVSFAFYLVHAIVLVTGREVLGDRYFSTPAALGVMLAYVAVSLVLAELMYRFVEKPAVARWSMSRAEKARRAAKRAAATAASASTPSSDEADETPRQVTEPIGSSR